MLKFIFGYLGKVTQEEVDTKKYFLDDYIGRTGIEENYENQLRGTYGEELTEVDSLGKSQKVLATKNPIPGNDLTLSIDSELQNILYQSLKSKLSGMNTSKAAAVAMDPRNGKILALVSLPSYDNNGFINEDSEYIAKLFQDKNQPLFNRAISGEYPPGSTIKPAIATAALSEGVITPSTIINGLGGVLRIGNYSFGDWMIHGSSDVRTAIAGAQVCNRICG